MPGEASIEYKYSTVAAKYYRDKLRAMAEGEVPNMPVPPIESGTDLITDPEQYGEPEVDEEDKEEGGKISGMLGSAINNTMNIGKGIYGKVKEIDSYRKIEDGAVAAVSKVGEGIKWSAQKGKEKIEQGVEWGAQKGLEHIEKGASYGSKGANLLKSGAISALDQVSTTASTTFNKFQIGEKAKSLKDDTMGMLNTLEKHTIGKVKIRVQKNSVSSINEDEEPSSPPEFS